MALTTDPFDATELAAFIVEKWPGFVQKAYYSSAVAANFFRDMTEFVQADTCHIPDAFTNEFSVQTQTTQGTEVTTDAPALVDNTFSVSTHKYIATLLGDLQRQQISGNYSVSAEYGHKAGGVLMEDFEDAIFDDWSSISTNTVGDTATILNDSEIRRGIEKLDTADVPLDECAFFAHPYTFWVQLHSIAKYYDAQQAPWNENNSATRTGNFGAGNWPNRLRGTLYGIPVYTSSRVVSGLQTHRNILAHKNAIVFAHQTPAGGRVRVQAAYWLANIGTLTVWDTIYGESMNRQALAVLLNANSSFIGS